MKRPLFLILFFLFHFLGYATANDTILLPAGTTQVSIKGKEQYFFSKTDRPIQQIIHEKFKPKEEVDLSYISGFVWVKFIVQNGSDLHRFVLYASSGHIAGLYMYKPTPAGYQITPAGKHHPEDGREIYNRAPAFFLELQNGETKTFYLKIQVENEQADLTYFIRDYPHYIEYSQSDYMILGLYFGALLIIIMVNMFYFISLKDSLFLVYAIYVFGTFLSNSTIDGFAWLLIPNKDVAYHVSYFCFRFWADALILFTMQLVNLKKRHLLFAKVAYAFIIYHIGLMTILEFTDAFHVRETLMAQWETVNCMLGLMMAFFIMLISYKDNKTIFKYYVFAFSALLVIVLLLPMYAFGGSEEYLIFHYGVKTGTLVEMVTLSFAVSQRFKLTENDLKHKKEEERFLNDKVRQLEMDMRKAQMNPHFMSNALSSIEYFILSNDSKQARSYLNKFSRLMRLTLDHSRSNFVTLQDELDALKLYMELEFLRLEGHEHRFEIRTSENIDLHGILVPPLLIQPLVENAIWHGLQKKDKGGSLLIDLTLSENHLNCTVEDRGPGLSKISEPKDHKSSGMFITKERLALIHSILNTTYQFKMESVKNEEDHSSGTSIQFSMPYLVGDY